MAANAFPVSPPLSGPEKAAAFLLLAGKEAATRLADYFSEDELRGIFTAATKLERLTVEEVEALVAEFHGQFARNGLVKSPGSVESLFEGMRPGVDFSEFVSGGAVAELDEVESAAPVSWEEIARRGVEPVLAFVNDEHPQSGAYLLSRLDQTFAAKVLEQLPTALRNTIVVRLVDIHEQPGTLADEIDRLLIERFSRKDDEDIDVGALERIAGVVNELPVEHVEQILALIDEANAAKASHIRKRLFRFEGVEALAQPDRAILFDGLSAEEIARAVSGASDTLKEAVLSVLSQRNRRSVEAELADAKYTDDMVAETRRRIAKRALTLSLEGKISLTASAEG